MPGMMLKVAVAAVLVCAVVGVGAASVHPEPVNAEEPRCGFDELQARTVGTRAIGVSRMEPPAGDPTGAAAAAVDSWHPIRIAVFTDDMSYSSRYCTRWGETRPTFDGRTANCTSEDILTKGKKRALLEFLIPSAVQLHAERLKVQRQNGNLVVDPFILSDPICGRFSIPHSHMTTGVPNADFVLYVSAAPTRGNVAAWALGCQRFKNGRPSVGVSNVSPRYLSSSPESVRIIAHELLHALGFSSETFSARLMVSFLDIREKDISPTITSANVVAQAKAHYGCDALNFMELEDRGGIGTANSHWKRRSAKDELMAGISGAGIYSALSIAAMEDTGYYKGNYSNAETMSYGKNTGCALQTGKCVVRGVSQFTGMFCGSTDSGLVCSSDRLGIGACDLTSYVLDLPKPFQYFESSKLGGSDPLMDYCPFVRTFGNTNCTVDTNVLKGGVYGVDARCLDTPNGFAMGGNRVSQNGICAKVQCGSSTYGVKLANESTFTTCPPGKTLQLSSLSSSFSAGSLTCPSYESVCAIKVDAALYEEYDAIIAGNNVAGVRSSLMAALAMLPMALLMV
ncbi:hypothetical protein JIQ42_03013 [Leishmania sp. Namibia]|uniref:hypothetical protein n=1 Tax=Leishmania sp. Namibia TaxID=2802991 RepID=UPI001B6A3399|nr:hypothetical protein JIQ42_03013 [Leishmania sp. Namibia]